jgi:Response regulator containing a CheY-like receiver domain and an HTH DNA-binding domain
MLSDSELRVLALVGEGLDDEEVGAQLDISPATAQTHRSRILRKLGISNSAKLVAFAVQHGVAGRRSA